MDRQFFHGEYPTRSKARAIIRDADLQIEIPSPIEEREKNEGMDLQTLNHLLAYYHKQGGSATETTPVLSAIHKAESNFQFMMKIRKELSRACLEVLRLL